MHFYYGYAWDKGDYYSVNQDSFSLQTVLTGRGPAALAVVCDGVGGLSRGEYASGYVAKQITAWFYEKALPRLCSHKSMKSLKRSFQRELEDIHEFLKEKTEAEGIQMGTTMTVFLVFRKKYCIFHVGDSRCYALGKKRQLLTADQVGKRKELLYAVGVGKQPVIYFKQGRCRRRQRFLLCSDGFAHCLSEQVFLILQKCERKKVVGFETQMNKILEDIIERGRQKGERDNCTAILLECY